MPSEALALRWCDVDFEHDRIQVRSPKTEHHEGGDSRMLPLFPELRGPLLEVFGEAEPGTENVITRYRDTRQNLRTQLCRIIKRAGLKQWEKPWHNCRSTRQTELAERYPIHVVCAWLGNSRAVAQSHYLQVTDAHFQQAATPVAKAAHNPAQSGAESACIEQKATKSRNENRPELPSDTSSYRYLTNKQAFPTGV